jgi:hypothetical protein
MGFARRNDDRKRIEVTGRLQPAVPVLSPLSRLIHAFVGWPPCRHALWCDLQVY